MSSAQTKIVLAPTQIQSRLHNGESFWIGQTYYTNYTLSAVGKTTCSCARDFAVVNGQAVYVDKNPDGGHDPVGDINLPDKFKAKK